MTVLRTGSNKKYAENWENIFGNKRAAKGKAAAAKGAKKTAKKSAKKSTSKKSK